MRPSAAHDLTIIGKCSATFHAPVASAPVIWPILTLFATTLSLNTSPARATICSHTHFASAYPKRSTAAGSASGSSGMGAGERVASGTRPTTAMEDEKRTCTRRAVLSSASWRMCAVASRCGRKDVSERLKSIGHAAPTSAHTRAEDTAETHRCV